MEYFSSCMLENVEGYWEMDWEERMRLAAILDEAHRKTWERFGNAKESDEYRGLVFCSLAFWPEKQKILKEEYGVEWKPPCSYPDSFQFREIANLDEMLPETLEQFEDIKWHVQRKAVAQCKELFGNAGFGTGSFIRARIYKIFLEEYNIQWISSGQCD